MRRQFEKILAIFMLGSLIVSCQPQQTFMGQQSPTRPSIEITTPSTSVVEETATITAQPASIPTETAKSTVTVSAKPSVSISLPTSSLPSTLGLMYSYDMAQGQITAFGGTLNGVCEYCSDTWVWNFITWKKVQSANHPDGRMGASFIYDPARNVSLLFGGHSANGFLGDTWLWNGQDWLRQRPVKYPSARANAVVAYDKTKQVILLFGGETTGTSRFDKHLNDTWMWDGKDWNELHPATQPTVDSGFPINMAYNTAHQNIVLMSRGIWTWDGRDWTGQYRSNLPIYYSRGALGYDTTHQQMVWFGPDAMASNNVAITRIWNDTDWISVFTPGSLNRVGTNGMIDDPLHQILILFVSRGSKTDNQNEAWAWDGTRWSQIY